MVITTESGSQYHIVDGLCRKYDADGNRVDTFKAFDLRSLDDDVSSWEDVAYCPPGIEVGKRAYIGGFNAWWITTKVVSVSEVSAGDD